VLHDKLCEALERAIGRPGQTGTICWFSMGEAIRLTESLHRICVAYRKDPQKYKQPIEYGVREAYGFLTRTNGSRLIIDELRQCITQIELENPHD
jgi:hypothetical protein